MRRTPTATHWGSYEAVTRDGQVVALEPLDGDREPSPIAAGMASAQRDAVRIAAPMVRRGWLENGPGAGPRGGDPFVEVGWDEALDLVAADLARVKERHGNASIYAGSYGWASAGRFHHAQSQLRRFLDLHGGCTTKVGSYSTGTLEVILPHVIGGAPRSVDFRAPAWSELAEHGELIVSFGGLPLRNAQVNPGGVGRHEVAGWQRRCREAGVELVCVSPLRTDASAWTDAHWLAPRPGTDTALVLALIHTLIVEDRHDEAFARRCCVGFDELRAAVLEQGRDADWAAEVCELEAEAIRALARRIAERRTLIAVTWSLQRADHGEQLYHAAVALAALSGSLGRPGGGFAAGFAAEQRIGTSRGSWPIAAVPREGDPIDSFIPVARITDMLLGPGEPFDYDGRRLTFPDIRLVYWAGGNPFHHHQDLNRFLGAWQRLETVVVHDSWWNATARHADVVLPMATALERDDFACGAADRWLLAMHKATEPPGSARTDHAAFAGLAERLGFGAAFTEGRSEREWVEHLYARSRSSLAELGVEVPDFATFWERGRVELPEPPSDGLGDFARLREDPDAHPLATPSGRIELRSERIAGYGYDDSPGLPTWFEPAEWLGSPLAERFPLHLLSPQPARRLHSQYDNGKHSRAGKIAGREPILIHPDDAAARGIADGDVVRVFNDRGACLAGARVTDAIRPGVVQLATGAWYDPQEPGVPGSLELHGNPNVLTLDKGTSRLAQGSSAQTALVEIERYDGEPPPVRAFEPPQVVAPTRPTG